MKNFEGLKRCREKNALIFKDLKEVVEKENIRGPMMVDVYILLQGSQLATKDD
jgi:hypothetical protein